MKIATFDFAWGIYDGGGCFFDYSDKGKIKLFFVRPPNRPTNLQVGRMYRLRQEGEYKAPVYYVEEAVR